MGAASSQVQAGEVLPAIPVRWCEQVVPKEEPRPGPRWGHAAVVLPGSGDLLITGGTDQFKSAKAELWTFNTASRRWWSLETACCPRLSAHTASVVPARAGKAACVVCFGGDGAPTPDSRPYLLDTGTWTWSLPQVQSDAATGTRPAWRRTHAGVAVGDRVWLIGGQTATKEILDDIWALDLEESGRCRWSLLQVGPSSKRLSPRCNHSATWSPGSRDVFVFGGFDGKESLGDLWAVEAAPGPGAGACRRVYAAGPAPGARGGHAAVHVECSGPKILFVGGECESQSGKILCQDIIALDIYHLAWVAIDITGSVDWAPRGWCSASWGPQAPAQVFVFGGGTHDRFYGDLWALTPASDACLCEGREVPAQVRREAWMANEEVEEAAAQVRRLSQQPCERGGAPDLKFEPLPIGSTTLTFAAVLLTPGTKCRYMSDSGRGIDAVIQKFNESDCTYNLNVERHAALDRIAPRGNVTGKEAWPPGTHVNYSSVTLGGWVRAVVMSFNEKAGTYDLDVREGADLDRIRARADRLDKEAIGSNDAERKVAAAEEEAKRRREVAAAEEEAKRRREARWAAAMEPVKRRKAVKGKYVDVDAIFDALQTRDTKLIKGTWLCDHCVKVVRCQDLPPEAFWDVQALRQLIKRVEIVALSYCWLDEYHPDPKSEHLCLLKSIMKMRLDCTGGDRVIDVAIFWDYMSLPQKGPNGENRTAEEEEIFQRGLQAVNLWYAHQDVAVWLQKGVANFDVRGWPVFENLLSHLLTDATKVLDLSKLHDTKTNWLEASEPGRAGRKPPVLPEEFRRRLGGLTFTNKADKEFVARKYAKTFEDVIGNAKDLWFGDLQWEDEEAGEMALVMPHCQHLYFLSLSGNRIGASGAEKLLLAAKQMPNLKLLDLSQNPIAVEDVARLSGMWRDCGKDRCGLRLPQSEG